MGKDPVGAGTFFPSPMLVPILHSSMLEMSSGMEECKITAWAKDNMPLAYAGILHSSMPEMSEESLNFCILCS
jgi:hypothetical protein